MHATSPTSSLFRWTSLGFCLALAACSTTQPLPYAGVASSPQMRTNHEAGHDHMPYQYKAAADWTKYRAVIVEPVEIYGGRDNQFEDTSEEDKVFLARTMQTEFADKLSAGFAVTSRPAADTLRIKLTLTGAKRNTAFLSTFSRFDLVGGPYNAVQEIRGKEGAMTGSVSFAVEIYDSNTNTLLAAYVSKQYPSAWSVGATIGAMSASLAGIRGGADQLVAYLR
jgi:hypothetical protein